MSFTRHHPYGRNEEVNGERPQRFVNLHTDSSSNPMAEAIQMNIRSLGEMVPRTTWARTSPSRSNVLSNDDFASNGSEPASGVAGTSVQQGVLVSCSDNALPTSQTAAATQFLASAHSENDQVYQPLRARPTANSTPASAPSYTMEFVTVAPGVQIQKKKFLPRCLPGPVGSSPAVQGRAIIGRGAKLYNITPKPDLLSEFSDQKKNETESLSAGAATDKPSTSGVRSLSAAGSSTSNPQGDPQDHLKWPFA